jgi:hypothetical protein
MSRKRKKQTWTFPLPRTHTGMLLGNATLGAMVWGEGPVLRVTLGRADCWDHRGGLHWDEKVNYHAIREALEQEDEATLSAIFHREIPPGEPKKPSVLPLGRFELNLGKDAQFLSGELDLQKGEIAITYLRGAEERTLHLTMSMDAPVVACRLADGEKARITRVPAWEYVGDHLASISFREPTEFSTKKVSGWVQPRPADPPVCAAARRDEETVFFTVLYGEDEADAQNEAKTLLKEMADTGYDGIRKAAAKWWKGYWKRVPGIVVPDENLQSLYDYGMYKFAGLTRPEGVAATLQGPWIEEYQMPPWSSDYHFNINVQMCYWPAFHSGLLDHLHPLWDLIFSWWDRLQHNARVFVGIDDGVMLPHAVSDQGVCIGGMWTGSVDHGCTAWVAQMMFRHYRYEPDEAFLREKAYPFMHAAMRVYEEMLDERDGRLYLPVSVSPEYRGGALNAWGVNASFQLACIHRLAEDLQDAAAILGETPRPIWQRIREELPRATLIAEDGHERIALWEGTPLEMSHRHHSHLAGVTPFDVIGFEDPSWREILAWSFAEWIERGPGLWSGWCIPWAGMLHTRAGNADAAVLWLHVWQELFTNEGQGTLHDAGFPGFSLMGAPAVGEPDRSREKMQMDAGMATVAAIQELLVSERRGVVHLFAGAPKRWTEVSFGPVRTIGGFAVSAARAGGQVRSVRIEATAGGTFRLANPWDGGARVRRGPEGSERVAGTVLEIAIGAGEAVEVEPA